MATAVHMWRYNEAVRAIGNTAILLQFVLIVACALLQMARGNRMARFFILGWVPALSLSIVRTVHLLRGVSQPPWLEWCWQLSLLFAVFMLLLATARAARYAEREMHIARRAATRDVLTGLSNRAYLQDALEAAIVQARHAGSPLSVLFLDIDHFKRINDSHGHDTGDACLRHFADVMQRHLRTGDLLARLGGEEFVALIPGTDLEQARLLGDDLRAALRASPLIGSDAQVVMTMSIGVACLREHDTSESLLKRADLGVYAAKAAGRDHTCVQDG